MPNLDTTIKRPSFVSGVNKETSNKSTGFVPIPAYKFRSLDHKKIVRTSFDYEGPSKYQYPDFELLKQQELERLGQKVYINPESLNKLFEITVTDENGVEVKKVLNLGEVLLSFSSTLQAINSLENLPKNHLNNQMMGLLFSSLGRSSGIANISIWFTENSRDILVVFNSLQINQDLLDSLPVNEAVKKLITPESIGLTQNIVNLAFLKTGTGLTSREKLGKIIFLRLISGDFDNDDFRDIILDGILDGRQYDVTDNDFL